MERIKLLMIRAEVGDAGLGVPVVRREALLFQGAPWQSHAISRPERLPG